MFKKIKAALGGRCRVLVSGGAPLSLHAEEFLRVCMGALVVQGYGLTETCAASFIAYPSEPVRGRRGGGGGGGDREDHLQNAAQGWSAERRGVVRPCWCLAPGSTWAR